MSDIQVSGGAGGIHAHLNDFDRIAEVLIATAGDLGGVLRAAAASDATISRLVISPLAMPAALQLQGRINDFLLCSGSTAGSLLLTAGALSNSAAAYRSSEQAAEEIFSRAATAAGVALGHMARTAVVAGAGIGLAVGAAVLANPLTLIVTGGAAVHLITTGRHTVIADAAGRELERIGTALAHHPEFAQPLIEHVLPGFIGGFLGLPGPLGTVAGPQSSEDLAGLILVTGRQFGLFDSTDVTVTGGRHRQPDPQRATAPHDATELLERTLASHRGKDNGDVQIEQIVDADGVTRWIVYVPATTDWSADPSRNGTDMTTNVETAAGHDSVMRETVRQAIQDAGIPPGDEVMITGFSQGGMTAASLAADPEFRKRVNVTAVMTTGSPVGDFDIPDGIEVLSLEHAQDIVPTLDGTDNPAGQDRTTARVELDYEALRDHPMFDGKTDAQIDTALASPGFAHNGTLYTESMAKLLASGDPSVEAWATGSAAGFFAGTTTARYSYKGTRKQY